MFIATKRCPTELCEDVVRVALNREPALEIAQIAAVDFEIRFSTLHSWIKNVEVDVGNWPGHDLGIC